MEDQKQNVGRREFAKTLAGAAIVGSVRTSRATVHPYPPGIKIATSAQANPTDEDLLFYQQVGVEYVSLPANAENHTADKFTKMRERYESAGIKVYNIGSGHGRFDPIIDGIERGSVGLHSNRVNTVIGSPTGRHRAQFFLDVLVFVIQGLSATLSR